MPRSSPASSIESGPAAAHALGTALRALALQEGQHLLRALGNTRSPHRGVHEARKAIRRWRSILLLGRKPFGEEGKVVDAALKQLATSLSALRDAHVVTETAASLRRRADEDVPRERWQRLHKQLTLRRNALLRTARTADPGFIARIEQATRIVQAEDALPWSSIDARVLRKALTRSLRRSKHARHTAEAAGATLEQRHTWRRSLRRLRMQWNAIKPLRHASDERVRSTIRSQLARLKDATPGISELSRAADQLGREQDMALLQYALGNLPRSPDITAALREVRSARKSAASPD